MAKKPKNVDTSHPSCPKCGHDEWTGPVYQRGKRVEVWAPASPTRFRAQVIDINETLVFTCTRCGYQHHELTKDMKET